LLAQLTESTSRLAEAMENRVAFARQRLNQLGDRPAFRKPLDLIRVLSQRVDETAIRLTRAAAADLDRKADKLAAVVEQLDALSPLNVLKRGYSLTRRGDGAVVRGVADVAAGEILTVKLATGEIITRVLAVSPGEGTGDGDGATPALRGSRSGSRIAFHPSSGDPP
jgi:exodeoxyribonuclease VII large subunit